MPLIAAAGEERAARPAAAWPAAAQLVAAYKSNGVFFIFLIRNGALR